MIKKSLHSPSRGESKRQRRFGGEYPAEHTELARSLRKESTPWERKLWAQLKGNQLGATFRRQQPIGAYIVDFICLERKVIIELDGSQHQQRQKEDEFRTAQLTQLGYTVLRFWNNELDQNITGVVERIAEALAPHQNATRFDSPSRGE